MQGVLTEPDICGTSCEVCLDIVVQWLREGHENLPAACEACQGIGHEDACPQFRRCDRCVHDSKDCEKWALPAVAMDMLSKQRKTMDNWEAKRAAGNLNPHFALTVLGPDYVHLLKNTQFQNYNWVHKIDGDWYYLGQLLVLMEDISLTHYFFDLGVTREAVRPKDRQDTSVIKQKSQCWRIIEEHKVTLIVDTLIPARRLWDKNTVGTIETCIGLTAYDRRCFYIIGQKGSKCTLYKVRMHSPADLIEIDIKLQDPSRLQSAKGVLFIACGSKIGILDIEGRNVYTPASLSSLKTAELDDAGAKINVELCGLTVKGKVYKLMCHLNQVPINCGFLPHMLTDDEVKQQLKNHNLDFTGRAANRRSRLGEAPHMKAIKAEVAANSRITRELNFIRLKQDGKDFELGQVIAFSVIADVVPLQHRVACGETVFKFVAICEFDKKRSRIVRFHAFSNGMSMFGDVLDVIDQKPNSVVSWVDVAHTHTQALVCCYSPSDNTEAGLYSVDLKSKTLAKLASEPVNPIGIAVNSNGTFFFTSKTPRFTGIFSCKAAQIHRICGNEECRKIQDGSQHGARFKNPTIISVHGQHNILVADYRCVRLATRPEGLVKFLKAVDKSVDSFKLSKSTYRASMRGQNARGPAAHNQKKSASKLFTSSDVSVVLFAQENLSEFLDEAQTQAQTELKITRATNSEDCTTTDNIRTAWKLIGRCFNHLKWLMSTGSCSGRLDCRSVATMNNEHGHLLVRLIEEMPNLAGFCRIFLGVVVERLKRLSTRKRPYFTGDRFFYPPEEDAKSYEQVKPQFRTQREARKERKKANELQKGISDMSGEQALKFVNFREETKGVRQLTVRAKTKYKASTLGPKYYEAIEAANNLCLEARADRLFQRKSTPTLRSSRERKPACDWCSDWCR